MTNVLTLIEISSTGELTNTVPAFLAAVANWPVENGWVSYESLQLMTYFITIFIAAPLALITGLRTSGAWPMNAEKLNKIYPIEVARAIHLPVMFYCVAFIIVHVTLVLATGALNNLNHMYAARDDASWAGLWIFAASMVVMIDAWFLASPIFLRPIASDRIRYSSLGPLDRRFRLTSRASIG